MEDDEAKPLARSGHTACITNDQMFVYGGIYDIARELNDMHVFDLKKEKWFKLYEDQLNMSPMKLKAGLLGDLTVTNRSKPQTAGTNETMRKSKLLMNDSAR